MIKDFKIKLIIKTLSLFLFVESMLMLVASAVSFCYGEKDALYILFSAAVTLLVGILSIYYTKKEAGKLPTREFYVFFAFLWIILPLFATLPYLLSGAMPSFTDAFFEAVSGFTTTGSTVLTSVENLSNGLLFWRSSTQWLGGICFIVLSLFVLPVLGIGGVKRSVNESVSFHADRMHPRIGYSVLWLVTIYVSFTLIETVVLSVAGMDIFDAVCHSFSTVSTGGFSTKTANIAYWNSTQINLALTLFMFLAGVNFTLYYYLITGKYYKLIFDEELRYYTIFTILFSVIISLGLFFTMNQNIFDSIECGLFHVAATMSTTGFYTENEMLWSPALFIIMLVLMFWGASYGSASGSVKTGRILLVLKNSIRELKRFIHPNAVSVVRLNNKPVPLSIINNAFLFLLLYVFMSIVGVLFMTILSVDFNDSVRLVLSSIGNIGCGTGSGYLIDGLSSLPHLGKYCLMVLMLVGRVELFAFFILFTRSFWRE